MDRLGLRPATLADVPEMSRTIVEGLGTYAAWAPPGWEPDRAAFDPVLIAERFATPGFFAVTNADCTAHAASYPAADEPGAIHLMHLFAREQHWGTGVAAALLAEAVANARGQGAAQMRLRTPIGNARGLAFYAREGFRVAGESAYQAGMGLELVWLRRAL